MANKTVPFRKKKVINYLDKCIKYWRKSKEKYSIYYVDAFQSVRSSLIGKLLPK